MDFNPILLTDSYKCSHWVQYPKGTTEVYSYLESRGGVFRHGVFYGIQQLLKRYYEGPILTKDHIDEAEEIVAGHFQSDKHFNRPGWEYILNKHGGRFPIEIKVMEEGTVAPVSNVQVVVVNTDPNCFWLTNYVETMLCHLWYPCTVATQSREMKKVLFKYLKETGAPAGIDYKLHDFGFRGVTCPEQACIGASAHLVNFKGTDTLPVIKFLRDYYGCPIAGHSIPASEHSTITSWGREREVDAMRNMLKQYPDGMVACVSDSFDIFRACAEYWGGVLKDEVLARDGVLVVRPDSGNAAEVLPKILESLYGAFGGHTNVKGYRVLHPQVRLIQGDGIKRDSLSLILEGLKKAGWSADNIAFGSGGGLLQMLDRDVMKYAFKCSSAVVQGDRIDVFKDPITDPGKKSKRGLLKLIRVEGAHGWQYGTANIDEAGEDQLQTVFRNGDILLQTNLDRIRELAAVRDTWWDAA